MYRHFLNETLQQVEAFREAIATGHSLGLTVLACRAAQFRRQVRLAKNLKLRSADARVALLPGQPHMSSILRSIPESMASQWRISVVTAKQAAVMKYVVKLSVEERERLDTLIQTAKHRARELVKARIQ